MFTSHNLVYGLTLTQLGMPTFHFGERKTITLGPSKSLDEARIAVAEQLQLIEDGRTTARISMKFLLREFPILRRDRRGSINHALSPLVELYVAEHLAA